MANQSQKPKRPTIIETSYKPLENFIEEWEKLREEITPLLRKNSVFEGRFDDGKKSGKGDFLFPNGDFYRGNFDRDLKEGFGTLISFTQNFIYKGDFKQDQIRGHGMCLLANGMVIEGYYTGVSSNTFK